MKKNIGLRNTIIFLILMAAFLSGGVLCFAKDINFEVTVDRAVVSVGETLQLNLTFEGTQDIPSLGLPAIEGFQARYLGPSTRMSVINGKVSTSITHIYTLLTTKIGTFTIGSFNFAYNGDAYVSNSVSVQVVTAQAQPDERQPQAQQELQAKDLSDRIFVVLEAGKRKIYLNETVPLKIKLYINSLGIKDIQYPLISHEGIALDETEQPRQYREAINGIDYDVIEFRTHVFGLRPGEFKLGPASIACQLIVKKEGGGRPPPGLDDLFNSHIFEDFFGGYQTYPLNPQSVEIPVTVLPLPQQDKPQDFNGAVGNFDMEAGVSPGEVKVGDPVTLKVVIKGEGNFNTVTMPKISADNNFKVYQPQVKQEAGGKVFEQIIMSTSTAVKEIPAISFSFFDVKAGVYRTLTKGPFALKVLKPEKEEESKIIEAVGPGASGPAIQEKLGRDIVYIKDSIGKINRKGEFLYENIYFLLFQIFPLLLFLLFFGLHTRTQKLKTDVRYARLLKAPGKAREGIRKARGYLTQGKTKEFYDTVFQTLQEYLGDKFHLPSRSITISVIDDTLKEKSLPENVLTALREIFSDCDMARFSVSERNLQDMEGTLKGLEETIDYFQRNKLS